MRKLVAALLPSCLLAACQPAQIASTSQQVGVPPSAASAATMSPPRFEVRDFALDEKKDYGTIYKGRGTLIAKDGSMSKGSYMVWLEVKQAHKDDEVWKTVVLLKDGIGTVTTSDYLTRDEAAKTKVKYFDWKVLGFVPLAEGVMVGTSAADASKQ